MSIKRDFTSTFDIVKSNLDFTSIKSVCDLGSGVPIDLFRAINHFDFLKITPVDKYKIPVVDSINFGDSHLCKNSAIHKDLYNQNLDSLFESLKTSNFLYNEYLATSLVDKVPPKDLNTFKEITNEKYFGFDIIEFLETTEQKYDLIIMSKSLSHVSIEKQCDVISKISRIMNPSSYIFIRLNYKGFEEYKINNDVYDLIDKSFLIQDKFEECDLYSRSNMIYYGKAKN